MAQSRKLGQLLVEGGLVTTADIEFALTEQRLSGERLGEVLVRRGTLRETDLAYVLAKQKGYAFQATVDTSGLGLDLLALARLPREMALRLGVFPLRLSSTTLVVAMANPQNTLGVRAIEREAGLRVEVVATSHSELQRALADVFPTQPGEGNRLQSGVYGWGLGQEERIELLSDVGGERLLRWIIQRGKVLGGNSILLVPRLKGGEVQLKGRAPEVHSLRPLRLSLEWYEQLIHYLLAGRLRGAGSFRHLETNQGTVGSLSFFPEEETSALLVPPGTREILSNVERPGLVLLCDSVRRKRRLAAKVLAMSLVNHPGEIVAVGDVEAPHGCLRVQEPVEGGDLFGLRGFRPKVGLLDHGRESLVRRSIAQTHPEGWLILPLPVGEFPQGIAHLRDEGFSGGLLSSTLAAAVEVGPGGALQVFVPNAEFHEALLAWDLRLLVRWRDQFRPTPSLRRVEGGLKQ